ncbi:MAG: hypothetical protein ACOCRO_07860 [Halanaerobiales bacterium]
MKTICINSEDDIAVDTSLSRDNSLGPMEKIAVQVFRDNTEVERIELESSVNLFTFIKNDYKKYLK